MTVLTVMWLLKWWLLGVSTVLFVTHRIEENR